MLDMQFLSRVKRSLIYTLTLPEEYKCRKLAEYNIAGCYKRIYLFHIRKTGGTSLNNIFLSLAGDASYLYNRISKAPNFRIISNGKVFVGWNKLLIQQGHYYYAFSHIPKHSLKLPQGTFTITCLRDPVDRVISQYKQYKAINEYGINYIDNSRANFRTKFEARWIGKSFSDFLMNLPKEYLLYQLYMFSNSLCINEAFDNIMACSHVFFTEEFYSGLSELSSKIGIALKPIHIRKSSIDVDISKEEINRLRLSLEPEYKLIDLLKKNMYK